MKIYHSPFTLTPRVLLNRTSRLVPQQGFFLMTEGASGYTYSEYFPHVGLGDQTLLQFKKSFPDPLNPYHKKILTQLKAKALSIPQVRFKNHELWRARGAVHSPVIKYKLLHEGDLSFLEPLRNKTRVRLDANGLFTAGSFEHFLQLIPEELIAFIDYIEDPTSALDWNRITLPRARDFVSGWPFEFTVYKPNRSVRPSRKENIIFSGNMGHALGALLAYEELVHFGDLQEVHGLLTPNLFEEEVDLFHGSFSEGFLPDVSASKKFLEGLEKKDWSELCTI